MTTYEIKKPKFKIGDSIRTWDDNDYRKGFMNGVVVGVSEEGITVKWDDLVDESEYDFDKVDIKVDLLIEHGLPHPPKIT